MTWLPAHPRDGAPIWRKSGNHISSLAQQSQALALQYRLCTAAHTQLGEQVVQVPFDRGLRQMHRLGDVTVRQTSRDKAQNLPLTMANILIFIESF